MKDHKKIRKGLYDFIKNEDPDYNADFAKAQRLWLELNMFVWEEAMIKNRVS